MNEHANQYAKQLETAWNAKIDRAIAALSTQEVAGPVIAWWCPKERDVPFIPARYKQANPKAFARYTVPLVAGSPQEVAALPTQAQPLTLTDIRLAVYRGRDKWGAAIGGDEWDYIADEVFALLAQPASPAPVELTDEHERMAEALHRIKQWSEAYQLSVFPEPDFERAHEVLSAAGMTLDAISASNMRHVITEVQKIVDAAWVKPQENPVPGMAMKPSPAQGEPTC